MFIFLFGFVFLIQAFNIPLPYGASIHLLGAALVSILIGSPWAAVLLISIVLIFQGLFFGNGGLLTLGANIFNMGIIGGFVGFYIYKTSKKLGKIPSTLVGGFSAGWGSMFVVGGVFAIELGLSGLFPIDKAISTIGLYSAIAGIIEGFMTMVGCVVILILRSIIKKERKVTQKGQVS